MGDGRHGGSGRGGGGPRRGFGAGLALGLLLGGGASLAWAHGGLQTTPQGTMGPPICREVVAGERAATDTADWMQRMTLSGRLRFVAVPGPEGSLLCAW